jgi:hypothetical protein
MQLFPHKGNLFNVFYFWLNKIKKVELGEVPPLYLTTINHYEQKTN